jgi:MEDS: MEthanogen/methylotroph, DcmR Sensory domain
MEGYMGRRVHGSGDSPEGQVNWLELDRSPHAIQFYSGDTFLVDSLSRFVGTALEAGDSCFVLASQPHLDKLARRLKACRVSTDAAVKKGRYVTVNAVQVMAKLMVDGRLNKVRFDQFKREVVLPLKAAAESKRVAVCGEVVALLWADGKPEAAIQLERFWNDLSAQDSYCLRCFYPIASFSDPRQSELFMKLCAEHASVIPGESHQPLLAGNERLQNHAASVIQFETGNRLG